MMISTMSNKVGHSLANGIRTFRPKMGEFEQERAPAYMRFLRIHGQAGRWRGGARHLWTDRVASDVKPKVENRAVNRR